jgi:SAM-dependent methyltransferase
LYYTPIISHFFHTSVYCLSKRLEDCSSVLDIGCGSDSPIQYSGTSYRVGVEGFLPSIKASKSKNIHNDYIFCDIRKLNFKPKSFDAIILIEVLEHLPKKEGTLLLEKAETWARKKVIVSSPNGYLPQTDINNNLYFRHLSGWEVKQMKQHGYTAYGMAGLKFLRTENDYKNNCDVGILSTIKLRPKIFWLIVSELTQTITYLVPEMAFEVFYIKYVNN